jgi:hypothetical protein
MLLYKAFEQEITVYPRGGWKMSSTTEDGVKGDL